MATAVARRQKSAALGIAKTSFISGRFVVFQICTCQRTGKSLLGILVYYFPEGTLKPIRIKNPRSTGRTSR